MHIPWLPALLLSGSLAGMSAAAIPNYQYEDLTFDAPIEHRVRSGDPLHFAGRVEDASITAIQFVFETNPGTEHDFFFLVRPDGGFERDLVFMADQQGSYHVHAFAGALEEATPFKGTFSQVVVDGVSEERLEFITSLVDENFLGSGTDFPHIEPGPPATTSGIGSVSELATGRRDNDLGGQCRRWGSDTGCACHRGTLQHCVGAADARPSDAWLHRRAQ